MNRSKYLLKNTIIFAIGSFGTKLVSLFLVPLYTSYLKVSDYGILDIINTLSVLVAPILMMNIHEAVLRFLLDKDADKNKIISTSNAFLIQNILISFLSYFVFVNLPDYRAYALQTSLLFFFTGLYPVITSYARGNEQVLKYSIISIVQTLLSATFAILFLIGFKQGLQGYLLGVNLAYAISILFAFFFTGMFKHVFPFKIDSKIFLQMLKYSAFLIPNSILWWVINSSDKLMIKYYLGAEASGLFAAAYKIPSILIVFVTIFVQAWQLVAIKKSISQSDDERYANKLFGCLISLLFFVSSCLLLFIKPIMSVFVAKDYYESWTYVPLLFIGFILLSLGNFVSITLAKHKNTKDILISSVLGAVINVALNFAFIKRFGINGCSFAACVSYFIILVYKVFASRKYLKYKIFNFKNAILLSALCLQVAFVYKQDAILMYAGMSIMFFIITLFSSQSFRIMLVTFLEIVRSSFGKKRNK